MCQRRTKHHGMKYLTLTPCLIQEHVILESLPRLYLHLRCSAKLIQTLSGLATVPPSFLFSRVNCFCGTPNNCSSTAFNTQCGLLVISVAATLRCAVWTYTELCKRTSPNLWLPKSHGKGSVLKISVFLNSFLGLTSTYLHVRNYLWEWVQSFCQCSLAFKEKKYLDFLDILKSGLLWCF